VPHSPLVSTLRDCDSLGTADVLPVAILVLHHTLEWVSKCRIACRKLMGKTELKRRREDAPRVTKCSHTHTCWYFAICSRHSINVSLRKSTSKLTGRDDVEREVHGGESFASFLMEDCLVSKSSGWTLGVEVRFVRPQQRKQIRPLCMAFVFMESTAKGKHGIKFCAVRGTIGVPVAQNGVRLTCHRKGWNEMTDLLLALTQSEASPVKIKDKPAWGRRRRSTVDCAVAVRERVSCSLSLSHHPSTLVHCPSWRPRSSAPQIETQKEEQSNCPS